MNWAYFGLICLIIVVSVLSDTGNMETVLIKRLMDGYDKHARPAPNVTDAVHVHFKLELQQIIDVDEQNQLIQLNVWLNFKWNDFRLLWDPANFGGVADVRFPYGYLWRPDVLLFNSVDAEFDTAYHSNMVVYSTGDVVWIPPSITRSSCKIYIKYFPFDDQLCYLKYGSWTFGKRRLTLHVLDSGIDTTEYKTLHNDEWILMGTPVNLDNYDYDGVEYQSFYVNFQLRRRTLYYAFNIIIPSLLITGMSLVGFYLPVEAGEKVALETTVLASICVCFEIVAKVTPPTSESIPLLGLFFFCHMVIVTISTVASVFILNLNYRTVKTHKMGDLTRNTLLNWLPWVLMMKRPNSTLQPPPFLPKHVRHRYTAGMESDKRNDWCHICQGTDGAHHGRTEDIFVIPYDNDQEKTDEDETECEVVEKRVEACLKQMICKGGANRVERSDCGMLDILVMCEQLHILVKSMTEKTPESDEEDDVKRDWVFAGMVIDRLCLFLFTIFIACSTMVILFSAPHVMA